jgi:hypothetical protein
MGKMPVGLKVGDKVVWNIAMQLGARITARAIEGVIAALPTPHTAQIEVSHGGKSYKPTVKRSSLERRATPPSSAKSGLTTPPLPAGEARSRANPKGVVQGEKVLRVRRAKNTDTAR